MSKQLLLAADGIINLALGAILVFFPRSVVALLGVPDSASAFYPSILGGVLIGIGIALLVERRFQSTEAVGLGLAGAIAINLCGGVVLGYWLVFGGLVLPARGQVFLWTLVLVLVGISSVELAAILKRAGRRPSGEKEPSRRVIR
jgi:hypothetical protein